MNHPASILRGTVHGRLIELDREAGFPDGQAVSVSLRPSLPPGEGLRRSFGAWAEDSSELDQFLEQIRRARKTGRPEPHP